METIIIANTVILAASRIRITPDNCWIFVVAALVIIFGSIFAIAFTVWYLRHRWQVRQAENITNELGLSFIAKGRGRNETDWYGGKHNELSFTIQTRTVTYRGINNIGSGNRRGVVYVLRLCLPISDIFVEGINIYRGIVYGNITSGISYKRTKLDSFDEAFSYKDGVDKLAEPVKNLLLDFVREHPGALLLKNRKEISKFHVPENIFPESPVMIIHDAYLRDIESDTVKKQLDDLTVIVREIEKTGKESIA